MKKNLCVVVMICVSAWGVCAQAAQNGVIQELTGDVQLKPAGASEFVSARPGDAVAQNTIVSAGFKSTAIIVAGGSRITVRPLTRLSLAEIQTSSGAESVNVNLQAGRVRVDVKPPLGTRTDLTVKSPSATASVRGTVFEFDIRNLKVAEGRVSYRGIRGMAVLVSAGSVSFVGKTDKVVDPAVIIETSLRPSPPVGTDSPGGTISASASEGNFSVAISYPED